MKVEATTAGVNRWALIALAEQQAQDHCGKEGGRDIGGEATCALPASATDQGIAQALPVDQTTARMAPVWIAMSNTLPFVVIHAEQGTGQDQMPGGGNRQEFGQGPRRLPSGRLSATAKYPSGLAG